MSSLTEFHSLMWESPWAFGKPLGAQTLGVGLRQVWLVGWWVGWLVDWLVGWLVGCLLIFFFGGIYRDSLGIYKLYIMLKHLNLR